MPNVTFLPDSITVSIPEGELLLEAARLAGLSVETPCGGRGTCGKCLCRITDGAVDSPPNAALGTEMREKGWVLICQARVKAENVTVSTFYDKEAEQGRFYDYKEDFSAVDKALLPDLSNIDFIVKTAKITVVT